jgi:hypothetical protein
MTHMEYGEQQWNDIDRGKSSNSEKNLSQCHYVHKKSYVEWTGSEPEPSPWEAADLSAWAVARPSILWSVSIFSCIIYIYI